MTNSKREDFSLKIIKAVTAMAWLLLSSALILAALCFFGGRGLFGYGTRIVTSSSMEQSLDIDAQGAREIPAKSLVVIELVPSDAASREEFYSKIREGDVLTFSYRVIDGMISITHRVKSIRRTEDGFTITLCGNNGPFAATQKIDTADAKSGCVIGKVVCSSYALGVLICILRDPLFLTSLCIIALSLSLWSELQGERTVERVNGPPRWREL